MAMKQKGFAPIIIIVLITLGIAGYFGYRQFKLITGDFADSPSSTPLSTPDTTINWKTYTNTKYSYQLRYPSTWKVQSMNSGEKLVETSAVNFRMVADKTPGESGFSLYITANPDSLLLTDWVTQNPDNGALLLDVSKKINNSVVFINGLEWEKIDNNSIGFVPTGDVKYGLTHGGNLYFVVFYSADPDTLDQIISTFKFLDESGKLNDSKYACPANGWVNCMPGPDMPREECSQDAMDWYEENCPDFQGSAV